MNLDQLKKSLRTATYDDAITAYSEYIVNHPDDDKAYTARGLRHWGAGKSSLAINDYLKAIQINPESTAKEALKAANNILDYRNTDLINP